MDISEIVLGVISEYRRKHDPLNWFGSSDFDYICAVDCACEQLTELIKVHTRDPPIDVIESYSSLMSQYNETNKSGRLIFRASADTAEQIVQILLKGE